MDILTGLLWGVVGFVLGFLIAALVAGSRIEDERIKAYRAAYDDAIQKSLDREQELIDYLTEEVPPKKTSVGGVTVDIPKESSCSSFNFRDHICNTELSSCTCCGDPAKCDFYEDVRKKAKGEME